MFFYIKSRKKKNAEKTKTRFFKEKYTCYENITYVAILGIPKKKFFFSKKFFFFFQKKKKKIFLFFFDIFDLGKSQGTPLSDRR